jgi:hypothetical protein
MANKSSATASRVTPRADSAVPRSTDATPMRVLLVRLAAGLALSAALVLGTSPPAIAQPHGGGGHQSGHGGGYGRGHGGGGGGGYYRPPPVVYGSPYGNSYYGSPYPPPPVVYLPGISIGIW